MITILVVDDELAIIKMLSSYFGSQYEIIRAINGKTALKHFATKDIDIVFLDWSLPDVEGIDVLAKMRLDNATIPIIMLTAKGTEEDKLQAFEYGADDYLVKPFSLAELHARVKSLLKRVGTFDSLELDGIILNTSTKVCTINETSVKLSGKEYEILKIFIIRPDKVFSREELLSLVWKQKEISSRAVDVAINRVRAILKKHGKSEYLKTIHGLGYQFMSDTQ